MDPLRSHTDLMKTFTIAPLGPFSLEELAMFGFGQRHDDHFDGTMRLAFCVYGHEGLAGVAVTQRPDGTVVGKIEGTSGRASAGAVRTQVARVLSLDHDARGYVSVGERDPVVARLLDAAPGLRPPLFYSPYEAAVWVALSARRNRRTASAWRARLSAAAGVRFEVAGRAMDALPAPSALIELGTAGVQDATGVETARAERVCAVAEAARRGTLDASSLASADPDEARATLRTIPGIGRFYADLILLRAVGLTDLLPGDEPHARRIIGDLYGLGGPATLGQVEDIARAWVPWRTWVTVLVRAAGSRIMATQ